MLAKHKTNTFIAAVAFVVLAAILYCSWPLGFWLNPAASRSGLASELGALGQPWNWLFIWADIVSGVFLLVGSVLLRHLYKLKHWSWWTLMLLIVYGICGALDAGLPMRCLPSLQTCGPILHDPQLILHGAVDFLGSISLIGTLVAAWLHAKVHNRQWLPWIYWVGGGGVVFALLSGMFLITNGPGYWAQRYYITLSCIWVASLPFIVRPHRSKQGSHS